MSAGLFIQNPLWIPPSSAKPFLFERSAVVNFGTTAVIGWLRAAESEVVRLSAWGQDYSGPLGWVDCIWTIRVNGVTIEDWGQWQTQRGTLGLPSPIFWILDAGTLFEIVVQNTSGAINYTPIVRVDGWVVPRKLWERFRALELQAGMAP